MKRALEEKHDENHKKQKSENPLFQDDSSRFVILPIKYQEIWEFYKLAQRSFWTLEELDLEPDLNDWNEKLNDDERSYIKNVLAFFAASDGIVNENLIVNILEIVKLPEARCFYGFQLMMENIHSETYSALIDTYISDPEEKKRLLNAVETIPCVKKKADWALEHINKKDIPFAELIVAFAAVEGIFFSASFCAIFWLKKRGLMSSGLVSSNDFISRDEGIHADFACLIYSMTEGIEKEKVISIIKDAVKYEQEFATEALPVDLIGINSKLMSQYIEFVADRLFMALGFDEKIYNSANPFDWMEMISIPFKSNIHENRLTDYFRNNGNNVIDLESEF